MPLKIYRWNYKSQEDSVLHMGPTAQSFRQIFQLGESKKSINTLDADGVILAGIKGILIRQNNFQEKSEETKTELEIQQEEWNDLDKRIEALEKKIKK